MHESNETQSDLFPDSPLIYSYSRKNMIDDGHLIEVPEKLCREAGIVVLVGILSSVWSDCVEWTEADSERQTHQDETGRLWDILYMFREAARRTSGDTMLFKIARIPKDGKSTEPDEIELKAVIGPGDTMEPVVTIMLPDED